MSNDSDNDSVKSNEESCPIEHRRVQIKLSESFARLHNQTFFLNLFSQKKETGGGPIENYEYKPHELHAIITYEKKGTADRLLKRCEVHSEGFMFKVTKPDEKQSTSDYISSKARNNSAGPNSSSSNNRSNND